MRLLNTTTDVPAFFSGLNNASHPVLLLDYDGTLAPFHRDPMQARPYAGIPELLDQISGRTRTRLVLVSGRRAEDLPKLLGMRTPAEIFGSHGVEHLLPGGAHEVKLTSQEQELLTQAKSLIAASPAAHKTEYKPGSVAVHWRGLPEDQAAALRSAAEHAWGALTEQHGAALISFDGGLEFRFPQHTKADAVEHLLHETGADATIAFLGDDITDEDAFRALRGHGLRVLVRPELRETEADVWLRPPGELFDFLHAWLAHAPSRF